MVNRDALRAKHSRTSGKADLSRASKQPCHARQVASLSALNEPLALFE